MLKQSGILYEDEIIQIGCKIERMSSQSEIVPGSGPGANQLRLGIFYGNKTQSKLRHFNVNIVCPGVLSTQLMCQVVLYY